MFLPGASDGTACMSQESQSHCSLGVKAYRRWERQRINTASVQNLRPIRTLFKSPYEATRRNGVNHKKSKRNFRKSKDLASNRKELDAHR